MKLLHGEDLPNATPVITLELVTRSEDNNSLSKEEMNNFSDLKTHRPALLFDSTSGVHFLTEDQANSLFSSKFESLHNEDAEETSYSPIKSKQELLEYLIKSDGSVVCKICGEILQSRTHWYRHKYKFHVAPSTSPAPIYKCEHCSVFFKSRKGYIGHLASRHPEGVDISHTNEMPVIKQEPLDPDLAIMNCELQNTNYMETVNCSSSCIPDNDSFSIVVNKTEIKKNTKFCRGNENNEIGSTEWEKQRLREERLVADIIARVRRECEAAGVPGGTRKGYTRRSALTNG